MTNQMYSLISQVYAHFYGWNGDKHSQFGIVDFQTSNRLIKAWAMMMKDSPLNPSTVKQLYQYNRQAFNRIMKAGSKLQFVYQYITYTMSLEKGRYSIEVYNPKAKTLAGMNFKLTLTHTAIKRYSKDGGHNDVTDVLNGLIEVIQ